MRIPDCHIESRLSYPLRHFVTPPYHKGRQERGGTPPCPTAPRAKSGNANRPLYGSLVQRELSAQLTEGLSAPLPPALMNRRQKTAAHAPKSDAQPLKICVRQNPAPPVFKIKAQGMSQNRLHETLGIELFEIADFLPRPREDDGQGELGGEGKHEAPLCRAVQLG